MRMNPPKVLPGSLHYPQLLQLCSNQHVPPILLHYWYLTLLQRCCLCLHCLSSLFQMIQAPHPYQIIMVLCMQYRFCLPKYSITWIIYFCNILLFSLSLSLMASFLSTFHWTPLTQILHYYYHPLLFKPFLQRWPGIIWWPILVQLSYIFLCSLILLVLLILWL